jgi:hypothetical protein
MINVKTWVFFNGELPDDMDEKRMKFNFTKVCWSREMWITEVEKKQKRNQLNKNLRELSIHRTIIYDGFSSRLKYIELSDVVWLTIEWTKFQLHPYVSEYADIRKELEMW